MSRLFIGWLMLAVLAPAASAGTTLGRAPMSTNLYFTKVSYLRHQAEQGDPNAQFILANNYNDPGNAYQLPVDHEQAAEWYHRAARQGHTGAAFNLAVMNIQARGLSRDLITGLAWLKIAAAQGHGQSRDLIPELEALLKPEHIAEAERRVRKLVPSRLLAGN